MIVCMRAGPEYLAAIVDIFTARLHGSSTAAAAAFYAAVPAASLAWVGARLQALDLLSHGRKAGRASSEAGPAVGASACGVAGLADDGFAFGTAFVLQVSACNSRPHTAEADTEMLCSLIDMTSKWLAAVAVAVWLGSPCVLLRS